MRWFMAEALWHQGKLEEALAEYRWLWRDDPEMIAALDRGATEGRRQTLGAVARVLAKRVAEGREGPLEVARYFALAGQVDDALDWLERAYDERVPQLMLIQQQPTWDPLRENPRFDDLVRRIGIPQ